MNTLLLWTVGRKMIKPVSLLMLALAMAGCATGPVYKTTVATPGNGAQVKCVHEGFWNTTWVLVTKIDGLKAKGNDRWSDFSVFIDPGEHVLTVVFSYRESVGFPAKCWVGSTQFNVTLQAGDVDQLCCEMRDQDKQFTLWIEDVNTHKPITEKQMVGTKSHLAASDAVLFLPVPFAH
jgi:hypothetical protein